MSASYQDMVRSMRPQDVELLIRAYVLHNVKVPPDMRSWDSISVSLTGSIKNDGTMDKMTWRVSCDPDSAKGEVLSAVGRELARRTGWTNSSEASLLLIEATPTADATIDSTEF